VKQETVVITGASAGLGRAVAREFGRHGANVALLARGVDVGWPTVEAIEGNKLAPGMLDHYLGRTGYSAQQTCEPEDPNRPDNLWKPVPGDHGAHGEFDTCAHEKRVGSCAQTCTESGWAQV
jgi:short subunit dehydrogenase